MKPKSLSTLENITERAFVGGLLGLMFLSSVYSIGINQKVILEHCGIILQQCVKLKQFI